MSFDLFGPETKCDIKVGYISTDRGLVEGINLYEANHYAKLNPGTQFIFRNRDKVQYLNINEVNKLKPVDMLPSKNAAYDKCSGIVGLNLEGDTTKSIDDAFDLDEPLTGGTTKDGANDGDNRTNVNFYGGGGVGVQASPIIGIDGSILHVRVIHGGYGYKYPPIVDISDDTGQGAGVVAKSIIKTRTSDEDVFIEEYDAEEDYEEYDLETCSPEMVRENIGYGQRFSPDGKDLGKWDPSSYLNAGIGTFKNDPIRYEIERYQKFLAELKDGTRIDGNRIKGWWTTRQKPPLRVTSADKVTRDVYDVFHWAWGSKPGKNDAIDNLYIKLFGRNGDKRGLEYWKDLRSKGQSLAQIEKGMKTFPEWKEVCFGKCKPVMPAKTVFDGQYFEYDKDKFMNKYAISPVPQSNVAASDNAGKLYTLEWEEEFPWDGDYIFNVQCDNEAHLYIDNDIVGEKILLGSGGAAGNTLSAPQQIKKFIGAGIRKVSLDLLNLPTKEKKKIQSDVVATSDEVNFNISISSLFANGITIEGLGIDVSKEYGEGKDIKETITKKVEYGRVYPVKMRSSGFKQESSSSTVVNFTGLNAANNPINVTNNGTRLALKDGDGSDTNASFTITNVTGGSAKFSTDGKNIDVKGDNVQITLSLSWNDNPRTAGTAVGTIKIGNKIWTQSGRSGNKSQTVTLSSSSSSSGNSSTIKLKTKGDKVITVEDLPNQSAGSAGVGFFDDIICSVNNGRFFGISGSSCSFIVDPPVGNKGGSTQNQKGTRAEVFNTLDWIKKANRKLWKMNPSHKGWNDADFVNKFGVLPFDPTAVAKIEKKRKRTVESVPTGAPPSVKFEVGDDGITYLKVIGNGRVKVGFQLNVNDNPRRAGLAVREIKIQADDGEIFMKREWVTRATDRGIGVFSAGKKYEVKILGGVGRTPIPNNAQDTIGLLDSHGTDWNADVKITSITPLSTTKQIEETVLGYPDYPNASTDDYAGFHEIIWNNINFPEDGNYSISTMVDDNVVLTFSGKSPHSNKKDVVLDKKGFQIRGDHRTGTGKSTEIKYFKSGTYTLKAVLEQIPGVPLAQGNPMVLAVEVKAAFVSNEIEVISAKSWNQNPFGVAMTIDAPMAPTPKEPPQIQEGRCPNNPIWTTRASADKTWYPVRVDRWSKFMNRYAISPLAPLGLKGTDGAGTVYRNSWKVELPYRGFYGVKGTVDNFGKLFIDGVEVLGPDIDKNFDNYDNAAPKAKKILLEKKTIEVTVEVENEKQFIWNTIDQKVFSTADWASKQNTTTNLIEGPKNVDVTFKVSSASLYANSITLFDGSLTSSPLFFDSKEYGGPNIKETHSHNIEVGKVYDVRLTSSTSGRVALPSGIEFTGLNAANNPINVTNNGKRLALKDGDGSDANASFTIDSGDVKFSADGKSLVGSGSVKFTLSWNDNPRTAGVAVQRIKIGTTTWTQSGRSGSETHTVEVGAPDSNNNSNIQLRNKGKNVIQMEDWTDNDWADIICSATEGEFYNIQGRTCKFRVPPTSRTEIVYGKGLTSGSSKGGVSYSGPPLSTYKNGSLGALITPTWNTDEEYIANFNGKTWTMTWSGVEFKETGTYDIQAEVDDSLIVKVGGVDILRAEGKNGVTKGQFNVTEGKKTIEIVLTNLDFNAPFSQNPTVAGVKITKKVDVAKVDPTTGTALGKPWTVNPIGVSAILIPPPCPKKINGVGIVTAVIITDPGGGFPPVVPPIDPDEPSGPPVIIECPEIIPEDEGINYDTDDQVCIVNTETGEEICFTPPKGPFGTILPFTPTIDDGGRLPNGFRSYPDIRVKTRTGIGYRGIPLLSSVIDPIGVEPDRLIQVTDLPGLKQTGYYDGRPYYGAVFYEDGIRYAGYYDTPGQKVQIYDTMQESIDAEVTTPPSAIQRQGTDINSNNPRLNIPGTPDNLT